MLAGSWEASFQAKKGEVAMPARVTDKVRKGDDGKAATGPGTMKLTIALNGDVKGRLEGALGPVAISGKAEGDKVRAQLYPDDPLAKSAMFGIFHGERTQDDIVGQIRVANGDASVVREADVTLKKK